MTLPAQRTSKPLYNENLCFVLVEPENPDNIGAAARAIKNMGFCDLRLINPPRDWRTKSKKMAPHATDVLHDAKVFEHLQGALEDIQLAIATSRRVGPKRGRFIDFHEAVEKARKGMPGQRVAFVFGKESKGLDNESLNLCDFIATVSTHAECPSINLAQAVMIAAFAMSTLSGMPSYNDRRNNQQKQLRSPIFAGKKEMSDVLLTLEKTLVGLDYTYGQGSRTVERIRASWHRLFKRSGLLYSEVQMLKGFNRRIQERVDINSRALKRSHKNSTGE